MNKAVVYTVAVVAVAGVVVGARALYKDYKRVKAQDEFWAEDRPAVMNYLKRVREEAKKVVSFDEVQVDG